MSDRLLELLHRLNAAVTPDEIYSTIAEEGRAALAADAALLYLLRDAGPELKAASSFDQESVQLLRAAAIPGVVLEALDPDDTGRGATAARPTAGSFDFAAQGSWVVVQRLEASSGSVGGALALIYATEDAANAALDERASSARAELALALDRALVQEQGEQVREWLRRLHEMAHTVSASLGTGEIFDLIARKTREVLDADGVMLGVVQDDEELEYVVHYRKPEVLPDMRNQRVPIDESIGGWVIRHDRPLVCPDLFNDSRLAEGVRGRLTVKSGLFVPIRVHGETIGVLAIVHLRPQRYPPTVMHILEILADQIGGALEHADLFERMKRSEERYRELIRIAPYPIVAFDPDGRIRMANDAAAALAGVSAEDLVGRRFESFFPPEGLEAALERRRRVMSGETVRFEADIARSGGERRTLVAISVPIRESGKVTGTIAVMRDVTEERELQTKLIQSEKLAALGELVSGVAHELNNPLAGIMNFAELVLMEPLPDEAREPVTLIKAEADRAARIVRNLLTFARAHRPERTLVSVNEVLDRALAVRGYGSRAGDIQVVKQYAAVPQIWADPHQLQHVFLNLILNAEQSMLVDRGSGTLTLTTRTGSGTVQVVVSDTGPGVAAEHRDRIFDPFFTTKPPGGGTGLGLSIAYGIVSEMGGAITYEEVGSSGARFVVELPVEQGRDGGSGTPAESPGPGQARILVVDDEPSVRRSLARLLSRRGYRVEVAADGNAALEKIDAEHFDVILTDVKMPGMDGRALFDALRQRDSVLAERVVFTTGDIVNPRTAEFLKACGRPNIAKPFDIEDLDRLLMSVVQTAG